MNAPARCRFTNFLILTKPPPPDLHFLRTPEWPKPRCGACTPKGEPLDLCLFAGCQKSKTLQRPPSAAPPNLQGLLKGIGRDYTERPRLTTETGTG